MKTCKSPQCKQLNPQSLNNFPVSKYFLCGHSALCIPCQKIKNKEYDDRRKDKKKEYHKNNREIRLKKQKDYKKLNRDLILEKQKKYNKDNKKKRSDYYYKNKENISKFSKEHYEKNKEYIKCRVKKYVGNNKKKINLRTKNKRKKDALFKFKWNLRVNTRRLFIAIGKRKNIKTEKVLGCTFEEAKVHFESLFVDGMNWEKLLAGEIEIDHIIPLSSASNETELLKLGHINNLQPLWKNDNRKKSNNLNWKKQ